LRPPDLVSRTLASAESAADLLDAGVQMSDEIGWIRSYVVAEPSGRVGTVSSY
jgi:hypothetical protein